MLDDNPLYLTWKLLLHQSFAKSDDERAINDYKKHLQSTGGTLIMKQLLFLMHKMDNLEEDSYLSKLHHFLTLLLISGSYLDGSQKN